jgi:hypothetical protein
VISARILSNVSRAALALGRDVPRALVRLEIGSGTRVLLERPLALRKLGPGFLRA